MDRVNRLTAQLSVNNVENDTLTTSQCPFANRGNYDCPMESKSPNLSMSTTNSVSEINTEDAVSVPVVHGEPRTSSDPVNWLLEKSVEHPGIFIVDRGHGSKYAIVSDPSMFEDILTFDEYFGNSQTPNMRVSQNVFEIPPEQLERHEENAIGQLRRFFINNDASITDSVVKNAEHYLMKRLGDSGEMDMRDFGTITFWSMNQALFGDKFNDKDNSFLWPAFEAIDNSIVKALKGRKIPELQQGVRECNSFLSEISKESRNSKPSMCPLIQFYDDVTNHEDPVLTAKFSTAALWGGSGNSVPATSWAFGLVLENPDARRKAYEEVDREFASQPNADGKYDYSKLKYLTASFKEMLRLKTHSVAWRQVRKDVVLTSHSGKKYILKKGLLVGLHFAMRHFDPKVHNDPLSFKPERFLGSGTGISSTIDGKPYAWMPFSAGRHKCSGYPLAMLEIPAIMALAFRMFDIELLTPLPGMEYKQALGVVGPDDKPTRIRYKRRT